MKKGLIFLMGIVSFLGINTVSAKEIYLEYETNVNQIKPYIDEIGYDAINNAINENIKYYNKNLANDYPYYFISLTEISYTSEQRKFYVFLTAFDNLDSKYNPDYFDQSFNSYVQLVDFTYNGYNRNIVQISYDFETNSILNNEEDINIFMLNNNDSLYYPYSYYYSNFNFYYKGSLLVPNCTDGTSHCLTYLKTTDVLYVPNFDNSSIYSIHNANTDFIIEPYYLYDDNEYFKEDNYISINLNEYPYVALSLKDYNNIPENNSSIYTNILVKGQLCITPVYNYGMTERKDVLTGTQVQRCSSYFNDFTSTRMYLLKTDVENHSIYYLKAYDTSKENIVKVDTSVFDITYITEETKDNPYVNITGKQYPTIAYDKLTDTATKSEDEDYISGVTCPVGDFNCYNEYNSENIFDSIFDSPLKILKNIWSSITSVFDIISEFISLLPETMQSFLFLSFMIAIILGLIKIIL